MKSISKAMTQTSYNKLKLQVEQLSTDLREIVLNPMSFRAMEIMTIIRMQEEKEKSLWYANKETESIESKPDEGLTEIAYRGSKNPDNYTMDVMNLNVEDNKSVQLTTQDDKPGTGGRKLKITFLRDWWNRIVISN